MSIIPLAKMGFGAIFLRNDDYKPFIGDNTGEALLQVSEMIYNGALEY